MMRVVVLSLLLLAGCGVDGAPTRPGGDEPVRTGVTVSGDARMGVTGTL